MNFEKVEKDSAFFVLDNIADLLDDIFDLDNLADIVEMDYQVVWLDEPMIPCSLRLQPKLEGLSCRS